jgi:Fe2+ transport system protein B
MKSIPRSRRQTNGQIFAIPIVLGVLSIVGLVSALVGDGVWDGVSWVTLAFPILLCGYFFLKRS